MKNSIITGTIGTSLSAVGTAIQTNDILETISIIITIIGGIITFIIVPLVSWYKKSKQDGKIDNEELKDSVNIIADGSNKIKNEINKENKKGK